MTEATDSGVSHAPDPLVLSIDVGTSSARALVYDGKGRLVSGLEAHRPYAVTTTPDGGVTVDAEFLLTQVSLCLDDLMHDLAHAARTIAAVACDTFWHSILAVDAGGNAISPVFTWADTRSADAATELRGKLNEAAVHERTGTGLHSSYPPAKLLWLLQAQPDLMKRAAYWMSFGEYLYLRLFGSRKVSISMASGTGMFDQRRCDWDDEVLSVLPIQREQLSPITEYSDVMKGLHGTFENRWPPLSAIPWFLPLGDGACNNVGSGGCNEQWVVLMVGTSGALRVVRSGENMKFPPGVWTYRVDGRRYVQGGALSAGGNVFAWLENTLHLEPVQQLEDDLVKMQPDGHGLTVLPFLAGERSPYWNPRATSAFVGSTLNTSSIDIVRASLEAIAYRFGLVYDILKPDLHGLHGIIGSGAGLIHSPAWMQIMADVLGETVTASAVPEATSRGAALLALESLGVIAGAASIPVPLAERYEPCTDHARIYQKARERQNWLYRQIIGDDPPSSPTDNQ